MATSATSAGKFFGYGFGRVGVLQEYLLTEADVERLLTARNEAELTQMLTELKMSAHVEYSQNPHRFVHNLERWFRKEIRSMVPEEYQAVFDILWIKDDASLLSYLLKRHHGFTSEISVEPHVGATAFAPDALRALVAGNQSSAVPESLARFVREMREKQGLSPQEIDTRVAQFIVDYQRELAKQSGSVAIQRYVAHHIDLQNIRTAHRLSQDEHLSDHLLKGGEIDVNRFSLEKERMSELVYGSGLPTSLADSIRIGKEPPGEGVVDGHDWFGGFVVSIVQIATLPERNLERREILAGHLAIEGGTSCGFTVFPLQPEPEIAATPKQRDSAGIGCRAHSRFLFNGTPNFD
mgnify:CR=1 FL=1